MILLPVQVTYQHHLRNSYRPSFLWSLRRASRSRVSRASASSRHSCACGNSASARIVTGCVAPMTRRALARTSVRMASASRTSSRGASTYERGGCHSAGFVDGALSVEACQATCQANRDCRYFSYHVDRPDKRCHLCKDDRPHPKCFSSAARAADPTLHECYWGPKYCRRDDLGTRPDGKREPILSHRGH